MFLFGTYYLLERDIKDVKERLKLMNEIRPDIRLQRNMIQSNINDIKKYINDLEEWCDKTISHSRVKKVINNFITNK